MNEDRALDALLDRKQDELNYIDIRTMEIYDSLAHCHAEIADALTSLDYANIDLVKAFTSRNPHSDLGKLLVIALDKYLIEVARELALEEPSDE